MLVSAGESLIDLISGSREKTEEMTYIARPGGSPYNCAIAMARLGGEVGFLCPFSTDVFGSKLLSRLEETGVQALIPQRIDLPTALAVVSLDESGHPSYGFYRETTADRQIELNQILDALPDVITAFHFGSLTLAQATESKVWLELALKLKQEGTFITLDPNLRVALIDDMSAYASRIHTAYGLCDVLKFSDEDLDLLYPGIDPFEQLVTIQEEHHVPLVILTRGAQGSIARTLSSTLGHAPPLPISCLADTVGAGDTFQAALLFWLTERFETPRLHTEELTSEDLSEMLRFANAAAGLNCMQEGCNPPTREMVDEALGTRWWSHAE